MKKLSIILIILLLLAGCSSKMESPIGIGSGRNELKKSPCACGDLIYDYGKGGFLKNG